MSYSDILALKHLGEKGYINPLLQQNKALVKSAGGVLYLDARKATGTGKTTDINSPFVDLANRVGKNKFDGILESGMVSGTTGLNISEVTKVRSKNYVSVLPNTQYRSSLDGVLKIIAPIYYDANKNFIASGGSVSDITTPANCAYIRFYYTGTNIADKIQIEQGDTATAYEPYTLNNATLTNFAGTTSSGYDISDPIRPFLRFDGTDDYGALVNTPSIDITTAPLAVFATVRVRTGAPTAYIVSKLDTGIPDSQYVLLYDNTNNRISIAIEGAYRAYQAIGSIVQEGWYNIGFIWDGTNIKPFLNKQLNGALAAFSGTITSRKNARIGCRSTILDGTSHSNYFKGDLATLTIYAGAKATEANVLKAEKALSRAYIGG